MTTALPHMRGLQVFEAVARHLNMTRAADELSIGQSAVTQQIHRLESYFGFDLISRQPGGIRLTREGEILARKLLPAMVNIREVVSELVINQREDCDLRVVTLGAFAYRWLIPRLPSFHRSCPNIDVQLSTVHTLKELEQVDIDIAVRCGAGPWPNHHAERLMGNQLFPVISPRICNHQSPGIEELQSHAWIHVDAEPRSSEWKTWLETTGNESLEGQGEIRVASSIHAIEAAIAGLGVALSHTPFVLDALATQTLTAIYPAIPALEGDYYIVSPDAKASTTKVILFRKWLLDELRDTRSDHMP